MPRLRLIPALLALLAALPAAAHRRDDLGPRRSAPVLRVNGELLLDGRSVRRALQHGETSWKWLREMHEEDKLLEGESREEFLVMNGLIIPELVRHVFRHQDDAHRQRAREAYGRARAGDDWQQLVALYSTEPGAGVAGDLGVVAFDNLVAPYNRVMFTAPLGEVQPPVQTMFGWHVGRVMEVLPPMDVARHDGSTVRRPETRRIEQILIAWDPGETELGRPSDLRFELMDLTSNVAVEVLEPGWCDEFPHWCERKPIDAAPADE